MQAFDWILQDLRYGVRTLWKDRRFAAVAIFALALGIGATTVIFSVIDGVLIEPFPYRNADRFVTFYIHDVTLPKDWMQLYLSVPEFTDFREQTHNVLEDVFGFSGLNVLYTSNGGTDFFNGCWVTGNISSSLGMKPLLGRALGPEDAMPGAPPVFAMTRPAVGQAVQSRPENLGTVMTLNGTPRTLIEIMPPRFVLNGCDIWIPIYTGHADIDNNDTGNYPSVSHDQRAPEARRQPADRGSRRGCGRQTPRSGISRTISPKSSRCSWRPSPTIPSAISRACSSRSWAPS